MTISSPSRITLSEQVWILVAAAIASGLAIYWSWSNAAFLLYGDAEAHIHIARRLFDSHRPGITQLGSVWLPFPHLLLVPFLAIDSWWRSGFAAVIPAAASYLLACLGLYRLARKWLCPAAAMLALALFATNPNLLYMQTTAMTEPLFLCELIWAVLLLVEWYEHISEVQTGRLWSIIFVLVAAVYTRYDGWILAFLAWAGMAICLHRRGCLLRTQFILASVVLLFAPVGWMAYNAVVFGDWLDFMRGPYSAKAIELRTSTSAVDPHPGWHNPWIALKYFVKAAEMDATALGCGWLLVTLACIGALVSLFSSHTPLARNRSGGAGRSAHLAIAWTLLLWLPLPFYAYSVSYGSVPIFLPVWKPFSWYNTRYGMELLPAFALFFGFAVESIFARTEKRPSKWRWVVFSVIATVLAANVEEMLREQPLTYVEAKKNSEARSYYNAILPQILGGLHACDPKGKILMNTSTFPSVVPHAGLTYRQTINESDKEFYWAALGAPAAHADIILAFAGDDIDKAIKAHPEHLRRVASFHSPSKGWDQLDAAIYVSDTSPAARPSQPAAAYSPQ